MKILWRRIDQPGHEICELDGHRLRGVALFTEKNQPCRLDYEIECDANWVTQSAIVRGFVGDRAINVHVSRKELGEHADIDLNFSPSTNLLPIRRLDPKIGESIRVTAAWLRFPSFKIEPLEQAYTRLGELEWRYESAGGSFVAPITVNKAGLVMKYDDLWIAEAT